LAIFAAVRRASALVSSLAAERRPGFFKIKVRKRLTPPQLGYSDLKSEAGGSTVAMAMRYCRARRALRLRQRRGGFNGFAKY